MLNIISLAEAAADPRAGSCPGAFLPEGVRTAAASGTGAVKLTRPRAIWGADVLGNERMAVCLSQTPGLQSPGQQYPHTTRITAASGGALGPHPARDPV